MTYYYYGMRLRGFSLGCQPMNGLETQYEIDDSQDFFVGRNSKIFPEKPKRKYYNILVYNRKLTDKELKDYELDYIGEWNFDFGK